MLAMCRSFASAKLSRRLFGPAIEAIRWMFTVSRTVNAGRGAYQSFVGLYGFTAQSPRSVVMDVVGGRWRGRCSDGDRIDIDSAGGRLPGLQ